VSPTATPIPERLDAAKSDDFRLLYGQHDAPKDPTKPPEACLLEAEGWIYGEKWTDCPPCVSPVLWRFGQRLNDRLDTERRQELKRFLGRLGGTGDDGQDDARRALAASWVINTGMPQWLEMAGLTARADELRSMEVSEWTPALSDLISKARDEIWKKHPQPRRRLREAIEKEMRKKLKEEGKPLTAAVVAAAAAADVADVADVAVVAAAVVAAAAAADVGGVAVAAAAAAVAAAAVAVAAVADVAVAAVAAAGADAGDSSSVYTAVKNSPEVRDAIEKAVPAIKTHREEALVLFDQLIDPSKVEGAA